MDHLSFRRTSSCACRTWAKDLVYHPAAWQRCADISFCLKVTVALERHSRSLHSFGCDVNCTVACPVLCTASVFLVTGPLPRRRLPRILSLAGWCGLVKLQLDQAPQRAPATKQQLNTQSCIWSNITQVGVGRNSFILLRWAAHIDAHSVAQRVGSVVLLLPC